MTTTVATIIRDARESSRMSQQDLARRAGVAQSVISIYESGRRAPSIEMLRKLIGASGHELHVEARPRPDRQLGLPDTPMGRRVRRHRRAITDRAARYGASNVRVFGSVARGDDTETSDIDFLVDLDSGVSLVDLAALTRELSAVLGVSVDVAPAVSLKSSMRDEIIGEAVPL